MSSECTNPEILHGHEVVFTPTTTDGLELELAGRIVGTRHVAARHVLELEVALAGGPRFWTPIDSVCDQKSLPLGDLRWEDLGDA